MSPKNSPTKDASYLDSRNIPEALKTIESLCNSTETKHAFNLIEHCLREAGCFGISNDIKQCAPRVRIVDDVYVDQIYTMEDFDWAISTCTTQIHLMEAQLAGEPREDKQDDWEHRIKYALSMKKAGIKVLEDRKESIKRGLGFVRVSELQDLLEEPKTYSELVTTLREKDE